MPHVFWKKSHSINERRLARVLGSYLTGQIRRIVTDLREQGDIVAAAVPLVFRPHDEQAAMARSMRPTLASIFSQAASAELRRLNPRPRKLKAASPDKGSPAGLASRLSAYFADLEQQPFWEEVQKSTARRMTEVIQAGILDGLSNDKLAKSIKQALGGTAAKSRAMAIARTETTGAMNAAAHAVYEPLAASGLITGVIWLTTMDDDARDTHRTLNRTTIKPGENFDVGGYAAPYPGHWSLPAQERVNCRCNTVTQSAFSEADAETEDDPELAVALAAAGLLGASTE